MAVDAPIHHVLLLGGTGLCGLMFTRVALGAGHRVTLYVRSPEKIPADLKGDENLSVIEGDLGDVEGLKKAASCGADVFLSFAGPTLGKRDGTPITDCLRTLYPLLLENSTTTRFLVLSTASYKALEDKHSLKWSIAINFYIKLLGGDTYKEINGISNETVALGDKAEWTLFRLPLLRGTELHKDDGKVRTAYIGDEHGDDGLSVDRSRVVWWALKEIDEKKWVGKCPTLANA